MKNEKLARKAHKDYELELRKEKELQELLIAKKEEIHLKSAKGEIENFDEILEKYDEINDIEMQLETVRKNINILAKLIIKYVFG